MVAEPPPSPSPSGPERPRPSRLVVALVATVLGLAFVEGAVRLRQWTKYGTTEASFYSFVLHPESGLDIPEPGQVIGPITINSMGFRSPDLEIPKPEGRTRIAFLGGSTSFCAEATAQEKTWPYLLIDKLRARDPELDFDFVNGGVAGYSTEHSLTNLKTRIEPLEPDVIVIYHGTNDLTSDTRTLATAEGLFDPEDKETDAIGEFWLSWYLLKKNVLYRTRQEGAGEQKRLDWDPETASRYFAERLRRLVREARRVAPVVCVVTFSQRLRPEQTPAEQLESCSSSLYYMPFLDVPGLMAGFREYNSVIRKIAKAAGVILIEDENRIPGDARHFKDSVHMTDEGLAIQAERIFEGLSEAPAYRAFVERRVRGSDVQEQVPPPNR